MFKPKRSNPSSIETLIGPHTRIDGNLEFSGGLHIDGCVNGNVTGDVRRGAFLSVSAAGSIEGSVVASQVILDGCVNGDIDAAGRVDLGARSRVLGSVHYESLETAVGAQINGKLVHRANAPAPSGAPGARPGDAAAPETADSAPNADSSL